MKLKYLIFTGALVVLTLFACQKEDSVAEPTCPECWDREMVCVDLQCECPEGSIENWFEAWAPYEDSIPYRKFCIEPTPYTFIGEFEPIACLDTFAITFPWEPLTQIDSLSTSGSGPMQTFLLKLEQPSKLLRGSSFPYSLRYNEVGELELDLRGLFPNTGGLYMRAKSCFEFDAEGNQIGNAGIHFEGVFIHPDTIRGQLLVGAWGTLEHLNGVQPLDLIRTVPYEED